MANRGIRNNNPGNLVYGKFAQQHGAIGTDGRFAIFPSMEMGRSAHADLIFNGSRYRGLTVTQMISVYAPPNENPSVANGSYQRFVLSRIGGKDKKLSDLTPEEKVQLVNAMEQMESGYKGGGAIDFNGTKVAADTPSNSPVTSTQVAGGTSRGISSGTIFSENVSDQTVYERFATIYGIQSTSLSG
jgi:hypothetical protein